MTPPNARQGVGCLNKVFIAALILSAAFLITAPVHAQNQTLTLDQARSLAVALVAQGRPEDGIPIVSALVARDPQDSESWLVLARALRLNGDIQGARRAAGQANSSATNATERFGASMELAAANFALERRLIAQFWLRRAAQIAPTPELRETAIRNFRQVAARTPLQLSFQFSVVPSNDVNNGSRSDTINIAGLPFELSGDAQALSGLEISYGGEARLRFSGFNDLPAQLSLRASSQEIILSDSAREQAPDASGSDFNFSVLELGLTQVIARTPSDVLWRLDTTLGRNWFGGDQLSTYGRVGLVQRWSPGERRSVQTGFSIERNSRDDQPERSAWIARLDGSHTWARESGGAFTLSGGLRETISDSEDIDHFAVNVGAGFQLGERIARFATLSASLNYEFRNYAGSAFSADGREDNRFSLRTTFGFPDLNYFGFAPTLTLEALQVESNVSLFDSVDYGVRLGVRSVF